MIEEKNISNTQKAKTIILYHASPTEWYNLLREYLFLMSNGYKSVWAELKRFVRYCEKTPNALHNQLKTYKMLNKTATQ